jgi:PTH1 family peptidyl-tRNA hydrolase
MVETLHRIANWIHHEPLAAPTHLIVGLGNPGKEYARNRHNAGFQCLDRLAQAYGIELRRHRFKAAFGDGRIGDRRVILAKPLTFMNESGQAVAPLSRWHKIAPENILVIHDDLDLPLGKVRLRPNGSSGGHKGINSIIAELGTRDFARLRIGIGRPERGDPIDYVLGDFGRDQESIIAATYELVERVVLCFLQGGVAEAMNAFNNGGQDRPPASPDGAASWVQRRG